MTSQDDHKDAAAAALSGSVAHDPAYAAAEEIGDHIAMEVLARLEALSHAVRKIGERGSHNGGDAASALKPLLEEFDAQAAIREARLAESATEKLLERADAFAARPAEVIAATVCKSVEDVGFDVARLAERVEARLQEAPSLEGVAEEFKKLDVLSRRIAAALAARFDERSAAQNARAEKDHAAIVERIEQFGAAASAAPSDVAERLERIETALGDGFDGARKAADAQSAALLEEIRSGLARLDAVNATGAHEAGSLIAERLERLEASVTGLAEAPADLSARLGRLEETLAAPSELNGELMRRLGGVEEALTTLNGAPSEIGARLERIETRLSAASKPSEDVASRLANLEQTLSNVSETAQRLDRIEEVLVAQGEAPAELTGRLDHLDAAIDARRAENAALLEQMARVAAVPMSLDERLQRIEAAPQALEQRLERLEAAPTAIAERLERIEARLAEPAAPAPVPNPTDAKALAEQLGPALAERVEALEAATAERLTTAVARAVSDSLPHEIARFSSDVSAQAAETMLVDLRRRVAAWRERTGA